MPKMTPFSDDELQQMYSAMLGATPWILQSPGIKRGAAYRTVVCAGWHRNKERDSDKPADALVIQTERQEHDAMGASAWVATDEQVTVGVRSTQGRALISWLHACWRLRCAS